MIGAASACVFGLERLFMGRLMLLLGFVLLPVISAAGTGNTARAGAFSFDAGAEISTGKYGGTTATDIFYLPLACKYSTSRYALGLTVPYISVTSNGDVIPGTGGVNRGRGRATAPVASGTPTATQSGLGDVLASVGYNIRSEDALTLNILGNVKFGTANANKGLGTGKNDYAAQLDFFYAGAATAYYASAGYKVVGVPESYALNNVAYGSIGATRPISEQLRAGLRLDAAQRANADTEGKRSMAVDLTQRLKGVGSLSLSLLKGLSTSSPDLVAAVYLSVLL